MQVTVLGCSGSFPAAECGCSGYLVEHEGTAIVVDLGPGCLSNLQHHIALDRIDAVVLSHSHPDHWIDLTGLHVALKYGFGSEDVPVWGTAANRDMAEHVCGGVGTTFDWRITGDGDEFAIGPLRVRLSETDHYVETHALRIDAVGGPSLIYSADTGPEWDVTELGTNCDLALIESTYETDEQAVDKKHLSAAQAGEMARAAGARRLVLTHFWPGTDRAVHARNGADAYGSAVEIATPHTRFLL